jgi:hypothetical protein
MRALIAVVLSSALIAVAIGITNHWEIQVASDKDSLTVLRLNKWTGAIEHCAMELASAKIAIQKTSLAGARFTCSVPD